jgi:hypothetical protein
MAGGLAEDFVRAPAIGHSSLRRNHPAPNRATNHAASLRDQSGTHCSPTLPGTALAPTYASHIKNQPSAAAINVKRPPRNEENKLAPQPPSLAKPPVAKKRPRPTSKNYIRRKPH